MQVVLFSWLLGKLLLFVAPCDGCVELHCMMVAGVLICDRPSHRAVFRPRPGGEFVSKVKRMKDDST